MWQRILYSVIAYRARQKFAELRLVPVCALAAGLTPTNLPQSRVGRASRLKFYGPIVLNVHVELCIAAQCIKRSFSAFCRLKNNLLRSTTSLVYRLNIKSCTPPIGVPRILQLRGSRGGRPGQGVWGTEVPQWGPGAKPRQGVWGRSSPEAEENVKLAYNF